MNYSQLVSPDLSTTGNIGWCLSFVEDVFKTPHLYATATDGWHSTQLPHADSNLPVGVYCPVWFSYFEDGIDYGHVAVHAPDGRVLSSPYKKNNSQVWFSSISSCASTLNCTYLGWSEDLATATIIKEEEMQKEDVDNLVAPMQGRPADKASYDGFIGQDFHDGWYAMVASDSFKDYVGQIPQLQAEVADLTKKLEVSQASSPNSDASRWQTLKTLIKALIT